MLKYTLKRIGAMVPVMLIISVVVFLIIYLTPGDPASSMLGMEASADQIERVNDSLGLNEPLPQRYVEWMGGVLTGDLGDSYFMRQPVTQAIAEHFGPTLSLALLAQLIASIPPLEGERVYTLADLPGTVPPLTAIPCGCRFAPRCARADERCRAQEPPLFAVNACDRSKCWLVEKGECHGC